MSVQHLLVGERVHRDMLLAKSDKMIAALRIQCAYRSHRTRLMFEKVKQLATRKVRRDSLDKLKSLIGFQVNGSMIMQLHSIREGLQQEEQAQAQEPPAGATFEL